MGKEVGFLAFIFLYTYQIKCMKDFIISGVFVFSLTLVA